MSDRRLGWDGHSAPTGTIFSWDDRSLHRADIFFFFLPPKEPGDRQQGVCVALERKIDQEMPPGKVVEISNKQQLDDLLNDISSNGPEFCLIEFYAPWCPHCHAFVPEYERVAQEAKTRFHQVTVARYNGSDNPIPTAFDIHYFPSFYLVGTKLEHPIPYDGQRSVKGLLAFIDHILLLAAHNPTRRQRYARAL